MPHTPLQDEYQVVLSRFDRPRWGKPVLVDIPSRLPTRGPTPTRIEYNLPHQAEIPVVRTWSEGKCNYNNLAHLMPVPPPPLQTPS